MRGGGKSRDVKVASIDLHKWRLESVLIPGAVQVQAIMLVLGLELSRPQTHWGRRLLALRFRLQTLIDNGGTRKVFILAYHTLCQQDDICIKVRLVDFFDGLQLCAA